MTRAAPLILTIGCWIAISLPADAATGWFVVNQPWVRPAAAGGSTEAYMNLTSGDGASLIAARSAAAAAATLAGPGGGAVTVREIALPSAAIVALAPGKQRISLRRLAKSLRLGDTLALTLVVREQDGSRKDIPVIAVARLRSPVDDERRAHRHGH